MDFSNQGASLYHDIASIYARHADGQLLWITGPRSQELEASWNQMKHIFTTELVNENARVRCDPFSGLDLQELQRPNDTFFVGAFTVPRSGDQSPEERDLRYQFVRQILSQARLDVLRLQAVPQATRARSDARAITELFSSRLRNMVERDEWDATGRSYFEAQAHAFTCRGAPVEFALPAFPCKSSNGEKVSGVLPDKGEELALRELDEFAAAVDAIYPPGCKVWIVSDGHVFSDCIGVDDEMVDRYSAALISMYQGIKQSEPGKDRIGFHSLASLFSLDSVTVPFDPSDVEGVALPHPVDTRRTAEAEFARKLLIHGFHIDDGALRRKIDGQDMSVVSLYRGFSRFMLEDLSLHPRTAGMSKSQAKKLASRTAFEMIKRNQAYSNLVETIFPLHIRLSIHAHSNAGPKFGIRLLSRQICQSIESLAVDLAVPSDFLHIPTPWHNSVLRMGGDRRWYIVKSKLVTDALRAQTHTGHFLHGTATSGGYYQLERSTGEAMVETRAASITGKPNPTMLGPSNTTGSTSDTRAAWLSIPFARSLSGPPKKLEQELRKWAVCAFPLAGMVAVALFRLYVD